MDVDYEEQQVRELIKCVIVGDTAVGKTRMVCAHAIGMGLTHHHDSVTHIPTVFAIDHYLVTPEVRAKSHCDVDGVPVTLRLWDTFGDHEQDRRFAYQNAHVIVVCFSVSSPMSFKNVNNKWYPEIKKFCPRSPIILVGTQSDLRYTAPPSLPKPNIQSYSLAKKIRECAMVSPDMGRQVAKEIGGTYYETSVITRWGVDEVFENAVRAALVSRRATRFWSSALRRVSKPKVQKPYLCPRLEYPKVLVPEATHKLDIKNLLGDYSFTDVEFIVQDINIEAHRVILSAASSVFLLLFSVENLFSSNKYQAPFPQLITTSREGAAINLEYGCVKGQLVELPQGFVSVDMKPCGKSGKSIDKMVIKVANCISYKAFVKILEFVYSGGEIESSQTESKEVLNDLLFAAKLLQLGDIVDYVQNVLEKSVYMNVEIALSFTRSFSSRMRNLFLNKPYLSDISFSVGGQIIPVHKVLITSRCEMLAAMFFEGHFRESGHNVVEFKDANYESFLAILEYLYTGHCPAIHLGDTLGVLALANYFCLKRLVALCERHIVKELQVAMATDELAVTEDVLEYLSIAQLHNASTLEAWCLNYITTHYNDVCRLHPKELKQLDMTTQQHLELHRWPPVWYLMEADWYDRAKHEEEGLIAKKLHKSRSSTCHERAGSITNRHKRKCRCL